MFLCFLHRFLPLDLPLLCPTLSISTCHSCSSSPLTAFSACTLTAMPLAPTNLTPLCSISKVLHMPASTQTNFYTNQLLHKHSFTLSLTLQKLSLTPTSFYTNPLSHKFAFPQTTFYTNQLLHKRVFTRTSFYANQLFDQPAFTETTFHQPTFTYQLLHKSAFTQTCFYTNQLLDKPWQTTFYGKNTFFYPN